MKAKESKFVQPEREKIARRFGIYFDFKYSWRAYVVSILKAELID